MEKATVEDWLKLGYSLNESKELTKLSEIGDNMANISAEEASESLMEAMKKFDINDERKQENC